MCVNVQGPLLMVLASFTVYGLTGGVMTAATAFPALALFNVLREAFTPAPHYVTLLISARVAHTRILDFLAVRFITCCLGKSSTPVV